MRGLRAFIKSIFWVELAAIVGLLVAGAILTWIQAGQYCSQQTFWTYRVRVLDGLPAWFFFSLCLACINGFYMFRLSVLEAVVRTPRHGWGEWGATLPINPLRLFAINLVAIPTALAAFLVMRASCW